MKTLAHPIKMLPSLAFIVALDLRTTVGLEIGN